MKRSASGLRSRWTEREIPEAYEIKGLGPFSAKLRFLEHRQQRISEVRVKYNRLRRELEHAKHNLILEPTKWNQEGQ
ncbi:Kinesin-like protein kif26b [Goodea atripinnis]|uniref:Kinesin-like protein kif26b n=1 Tax=Goodea atripinnis TaxID=208336 RepID=A0ABV0PM06_9TELE